MTAQVPAGLDAGWAARWGDVAPLGYRLREAHHSRWVRFHSLPESRRYPRDETEYGILLRRQHSILSALDAPRRLLLVTRSWSATSEPEPRAPDVERAAPGVFWRSTLPDFEEEGPEFRSYEHHYVALVANRPGELDPLLRLVAEDRAFGVVLAPPDLRWLLCPYDGGTDVIAASQAERDALRERFSDWLSAHPEGL